VIAEGKSILVVDDDEDSRSMVRTILENSGFSVEESSGGRDALNRLQTFHPSLVLLDIMMPEVNGYDVIVHMKQRPETQNIPVIMLTAKGEDLLTAYKDYGVEYYITKPFTTRQLLTGIELVLGS
jgi:CheY-like chemotaxis protein